MPDDVEVRQGKIQKFLNELGDCEDENAAKTLRVLVNKEHPSVKTARGMEDEKGYKLFWNAFYGLGLHIGERQDEEEEGEEQAIDVVCCCSCC